MDTDAKRIDHLAQQMRALQAGTHDTEPTAAGFTHALSAIAERLQIVEAYITPSPVSDARKQLAQRGWTLAVFRENPVPLNMSELADLAFDAQYERRFVPIELLSWSDHALELAEAMAVGIRVWPQQYNQDNQPHDEMI